MNDVRTAVSSIIYPEYGFKLNLMAYTHQAKKSSLDLTRDELRLLPVICEL
ncbi:hypothetical protein [Candidatus Leptofilum sp.]|uniref:hypothetical protein n=1 Tax=Candidatus Leptofilum sp. TaxID=3241576 RepID=UPI003B5C33FB